MNSKRNKEKAQRPAPIYIVSGGSGASGGQIVETVLAQFPGIQVPIIKITYVRRKEQLEEAASKASVTGGIIVHTLVNGELRKALTREGRKLNVKTIDLMGPLLNWLAEELGLKPLGQPGLYRQLHQDYFNRIEAFEFTAAHDDGQRPEDLPRADIILLGVSRSGKTPLSMYLAVEGWKVANVPVIPGIPLPRELYQSDRRRVIGLDIEHDDLLSHRKKRQEHMGATGPSAYTNPSAVFEELEFARSIYKKNRFSLISVTNKPIETIAVEIIDLIGGFGEKS